MKIQSQRDSSEYVYPPPMSREEANEAGWMFFFCFLAGGCMGFAIGAALMAW